MSSHVMKPSDRVAQLEANALDKELNHLVDQFVDTLGLPKFNEESKLILKLYIYRNHLKDCTTIGRRFYKITMLSSTINDGHESYSALCSNKMASFVACELMFPYLFNKFVQIHNSSKNSLFGLKLDCLKPDTFVIIYQFIKVLNFLVFLTSSKYLMPYERLIGLVGCIPEQHFYRNTAINRTQMEIYHRETIWRKISELVAYGLPRIDIIRVKNSLMTAVQYFNKPHEATKLSDKIIEWAEKNCVICKKQPFNPFTIGCQHLFCYYCLHVRQLSDTKSAYTCPLCYHSTNESDDVQRYTELIHRNDMIKT